MGLIQFDKPTAGNWLGGSRSINEASPLAKNLVDGYSVGTGRPVRHRKAGFATVAGATVEASRFGPLQKLSGSSSGIQIPAVPIAGATALQVTGVVRISSQNGEMVFEQSATADSNAGFYLYGISSTELRLQVHNGASSAIFNVFSYTFPSGPVVITVRVDISANPARAELWADGKLIAAYTVTLAAGSFTSNTLNIGCRNGTSLSSDGAFGDIWVHKAWTFDAALSKWHGDLASIYKPRRIWVPVSAGGGTTYTFSPSGSVAFSGAAPLTRGRVFLPSGVVVFSGTSPFTATGVANYTFTVSGGVTLSGASPTSRGRVFLPSGVVTFSGSAPFSSGASASYTFSISGRFALSGASLMARGRVLSPSGSVNFSGAALWQKSRIFATSGQVTFSGTGGQYFTSGIATPSRFRPLAGVGQ